MTRAFCTYFDVNYLSRGLALYESLRATSDEDFTLDVLCLDEEVERRLAQRALAGVRLTRLDALEAADPELLATKTTRSRIEYIFTAGPPFMRHLLEREPSVDLLTYLDSDLYFFSSPEPLFREAEEADASTVIVGHRFPPRLRHLEETGRFNVAWVSFRRDPDGLACLDYWRSACIDWCHDRVEDGRYADQKYLDQFSQRFSRVHELQHPGADIAPWNISTPPVRLIGDRFLIADQPLIFFHFQGLKMPWPWLVDLHLAPYGQKSTPAIRNMYARYVTSLLGQSDGGRLRSPRAPTRRAFRTVLTAAESIARRTSALYVRGRLL